MARKTLERHEELARKRVKREQPPHEKPREEVADDFLVGRGAAALSPVERASSLAGMDDSARTRVVHMAQQAGGNAAVARTLARGPTATTEETKEGGIAAVEDAKPEEIFIRLPPGGGWLSGHGPNRAAEAVEKEIEDLSDKKHGLLGTLGYLKFGEETLGPETLHAVEGVKTMLEKKTAGVRGEKFNEVVLTYANASSHLSSKLFAMTAAEKDVLSASEKLMSSQAAKAILEGKREEAKAEEKVKTVEAEIAKAKEWAGAIFDAAIDVMKGDWKDALTDIGKFAGKELLVNWLVDDAYSKKLAAVQKQLEQIKAKVTGLEDEKALHDIHADVLNLERAKNEARSKQKDLLIAAREAKAAWKVFEGRLREMGKAGKAAADALDSRQDLANMAQLATDELSSYGETLNKFKDPLDKLYWAYHNYWDFLNSPGGTSMVASEDVRGALNNALRENQWGVSQLKEWREKEITDLANARAWVEGGSYMADYDMIDELLASVAGGGD